MENLFNLKKRVSYYPSMLRQLIWAVLILKAGGSYAQAPTISYSTPQTYVQNTAITPLAPTSSGVASFGYSNTAVTVPATGIDVVSNGIALDSNGNIFVCSERSNSTIKKVPAGGGAAVAYGPSFVGVFSIAMDANNNLYVADYGGHTVYKIPPGGGSAITLSTAIKNPYGIAVDKWGNVYVTDYNLGYLWKLPASGSPSVLGSYGEQSLRGVAVDNTGNVYFSDDITKSIKKIPAGGGTAVTVHTGFSYPYGLEVDRAGNVFVADTEILMIPAGGGSLVPIASGSSVATETVALDGYENLYIYDTGSDKIKKINRAGGYFMNPDLPAGLNFDEGTGTISGTPTRVSPATNYTVTAYNSSGQTSATVNIAISPELNSHYADLSVLKLSRGTLSPAFTHSTTSYSTSVVNGVHSLQITAGTPSPLATITINGTVLADSATSAPIPLAVGTDTISIVVTAPDGVTTKTYTVAVSRPGTSDDFLSALMLTPGVLSPVFSEITTSYTVNVVNGVRSMVITPTGRDSDATIKVNGTPIGIIGPGPEGAEVALSVGANTINVAVTSSDGTATQTYTITVNRTPGTNDNLKDLTLSNGHLSPNFSTSITSYTATVGYLLHTMTVTPYIGDPDATITVNGTPATSGMPSAPITLSVGTNTINIVVTASDGTTSQTYTVIVTKPSGPANSLNAAISVSKPAETPPGLATDGIAVHEAISPNGDGINDFLQIDNISQYPDNKLTIMNRSGQMIYEAKGYDNTSKVFDGHSNKNGQMQLPGTYFYQLDYTVSGIVKHKTGYLVLKY